MYVHKIGQSFTQEMAIPELDYPDGYFVGWTVECQIRTLAGAVLSNVTCTWDNPTTTRNLLLQAVDTSTWVEGVAEIDVKFKRTADNLTVVTDTAQFVVTPAITRNA